MCLLVKEGCKIEIAEKDITTYKCVYDGENYWCGIFYSHPRFLYNEVQKAKHLKLGVIELSIDLEHLQIENCGIINEGFHSRVNPCGSPVNSIVIKMAICIIPKGSEYCFGEYDDIVSNQIIVFKTEEDYDRYIASKVSSD